MPEGKGERWRQVNQTSLHTRGSEFEFFSNAYFIFGVFTSKWKWQILKHLIVGFSALHHLQSLTKFYKITLKSYQVQQCTMKLKEKIIIKKHISFCKGNIIESRVYEWNSYSLSRSWAQFNLEHSLNHGRLWVFFILKKKTVNPWKLLI